MFYVVAIVLWSIYCVGFGFHLAVCSGVYVRMIEEGINENYANKYAFYAICRSIFWPIRIFIIQKK